MVQNNSLRSLRTLSDIVPEDYTEGLLLDMAADKEPPQTVQDYALRRSLGIISVSHVVERDLRVAIAQREVAQLEHDFKQ